MAANGIDDDTAQDIYARIESFANFGFAESHALSFAGLVYTSAWVKLHYPAAFLAALLRSQPMGFYSPATLVADARRHGVVTRRPDLTKSSVGADLEALDRGGDDVETGMDDCLHDHDESEIGPFDPDRDDGDHRRDTHFAVRLGLSDVSGISTETATRIIAEREREPFTSLDDLARRVELGKEEVEALALAGVFDDLVGSRRGALWQIGQIDGVAPGQLDVQVATQPPLLPEPTQLELLGDDIRATGVSTADHPVRHVRGVLDRRGVVRVDRLGDVEAGRRIEVAGVVTHRQRPGTAGGVTFLNVEDETGLLNVIVTPGAWKHHRRVARTSRALVVRGILERSDEGVTSLQADRLEALDLSVPTRSRDFR